MSETCATCGGEGWVCESHPDKPWTLAGCRCSPGMTCACNDRALHLPTFDAGSVVMSAQYAERRRRRLS